MIVIFSCDGDYSSDLVIDWLNYYEKPYLRINLYDFLISQVSGPVSYNLFERKINMGDKVIHLDEIKSVWLRKLGFLDGSILHERTLADGVKARFLKIIQQEIQPFFEHLFFELRHCNWICHPSKLRLNKFNVMRLAHDVGLSTPRTLVTNNKPEAMKFLKQNRAITKSMNDSITLFENSNFYPMYTTEVFEDSLPDSFALSMIQRNIDKDFEIRIFFLADKFYSVAIFSQSDQQTKTDLRRYNWSKPNRVVPYNLPDDIKSKLLSLFNILELNTGSVDMIKTVSGEFIFLEINPFGQFGMVEKPLNYNLHKLIAEKLIENDHD